MNDCTLSSLERVFRKQVGDTACGLASLAIVVDALRLEESSRTGQECANETQNALPGNAARTEILANQDNSSSSFFVEGNDGTSASEVDSRQVNSAGLDHHHHQQRLNKDSNEVFPEQVTEDDMLSWQRSEFEGGGHKIDEARLKTCGLTMAGLSRLAWNNGIPHACCYADGFSGIDEFRETLQNALESRCKVILNYQMTIAGQSPFGGHFSPVERYDPERDAFRILDVWKLTPTDDYWADTKRLWNAVSDKDSNSKRCRGFIVFPPALVKCLNAAPVHRPKDIVKSNDPKILEAMWNMITDENKKKRCVQAEYSVGVRLPNGEFAAVLRKENGAQCLDVDHNITAPTSTTEDYQVESEVGAKLDLLNALHELWPYI